MLPSDDPRLVHLRTLRAQWRAEVNGATTPERVAHLGELIDAYDEQLHEVAVAAGIDPPAFDGLEGRGWHPATRARVETLLRNKAVDV